MSKIITFFQTISRVDPKVLKIPLALFTLVSTVLALIIGGAASAGIMLLTCAVAILILRFEEVTEFDLSVFKGLRTKLERTITEASATVDQLRQLALALSAPVVAQVALSGQFMKYETFPSRQLKINKIAENLRSMHVPEEEIVEVLAPWRIMACDNLFGQIYRYFEQLPSEHEPQLIAMRKDGLNGDLGAVKAFLRGLPPGDPMIARLAGAYLQVCDHGTLEDVAAHDVTFDKPAVPTLPKPDPETIAGS